MRAFLVCIHDATPAYDRETRVLIDDLALLVGRRFSFGVVPDWCGQWPLAAHPDYCRLVQESSEELLLHGYFHQRRRGTGPTTLLTNGGDEMNGLDREQTRSTLERGQRVFTDVFGAPARGFVAPAWQRGHVQPGICGLEHVLGFFSLDSTGRASVPLATWTWDFGRIAWLGHVGHELGRVLQSIDVRVPVLAIHPRDVARGFRPGIMRRTRELLEAGFEPRTLSSLLEARTC